MARQSAAGRRFNPMLFDRCPDIKSLPSFPLPLLPFILFLFLLFYFFFFSPSSSSSSSVFNRRRWTRELKRSVKRYRCNYFSARFRCGIVLPLRGGFYRYDFSRVPSTFCFNRSWSSGDCRGIFFPLEKCKYIWNKLDL